MVTTMSKLKIRVGASKPGVLVPCEPEKISKSGRNGQRLSGNVKGENGLNCLNGLAIPLSDRKMRPTFDDMKQESSILGSKHRLEEAKEGLKPKRLKMDRGMSLKCSEILKKLMKHPAGWVFKQPVDPVALKIPDYFSIVKEPMDLGTIKSKLEKFVYHAVEEFEADVRLTFSNAILYNPPNHDVHHMAEEMDEFFYRLWRPVVGNRSWSRIGIGKETAVTGKSDASNTRPVTGKSDVSNTFPETLLYVADTVPKRSAPEDDMAKANDPKEASLEKMLSMSNPSASKDEMTKCSRYPTVVKHAQDSSGSSRTPPACVGIFPKGIQSMKETSMRKKIQVQVCEAKVARPSNCLKPKILRSNMDYDGAVSSLEEKLVCTRNNAPTTTSPSASEGSDCFLPRHTCPMPIEDGEALVVDPQLSSQHALRTSMLKSRFMDTIIRAQQKMLARESGKAGVSSIQEEKKKLEKKVNEEKARINAQVEALKVQRQEQRETARLELEKMEKSVDLDYNFHFLRDLESWIGDFSTSYSHSARRCNAASKQVDEGKLESSSPLSPLEQLGLFIKAEYSDDDEVDGLGDLEEGELPIL